MLKKATIIALIMLPVVLASGCLGGSPPPTLKECVASLDDAVVQYDTIMGLYSSGNYTGAREQYIANAATFRQCKADLETAAKGNVTSAEKRIADKLAVSAGQFAYAAQYMRDSCTEAVKTGDNNAYLFKAQAEEYALAARNTYSACKQDLGYMW